MAQKHPVVQRDETILSVLAGVFVVALAICVVLSPRALFFGSRSQVVAGDALPKGGLPADFIRIVDDYGLHIPKQDRQPLLTLGQPRTDATPLDSREDATPLRFGYSIREGAAAGLPFRAMAEQGHVIYYETPREFVMAPITDDYLRQVNVPMAKPLDDGDYFLWAHRWGWLFVIAAAGIGIFYLGAAKRKREALDLI